MKTSEIFAKRTQLKKRPSFFERRLARLKTSDKKAFKSKHALTIIKDICINTNSAMIHKTSTRTLSFKLILSKSCPPKNF